MSYLGVVFGVLLLDQFSKWLVGQSITLYDQIPLLNDWLYFTHWQNTGGAFGILQGQSQWLAWVAVVVFVGIVLMLLFFPRSSKVVNFGLALIAGGAMGNLIDRIVLGHVVDFVQVCFNGICGFPVFNVADSAIVVGTGLILLSWLNQKPTEPQPDSEMTVIEK